MLVQQVSRVAPETVDEIYTADYYSCPSPLVTGMGSGVIDNFVGFFRNCGLKPGELLEIACFDGYLLLKLADLGWSVYGCDPANQAKIAIANLGQDRVSREFFTEGTYASERFDAIVVRNLLEHIYDLHGFLTAVAGTLKVGGMLLIDVPNVHTTLELGVFGSFFHQHISYFSKATLERLLRENGFIPEHWLTDPTLMVCARKSGVKPTQAESEATVHDRELVASFAKSSEAHRRLLLDAFAEPRMRSAALFGASALSTTIVSLLDEAGRGKLNAIYDNDSQKHGKIIHGCSVAIAAPTKESLRGIDTLLITSYQFENEIRAQLGNLGFDHARIKPLFSR